MSSAWPGVLLAVAFVLLNGFFVAAEFAMVKVRATRLGTLARKGEPSARAAQKVVERLDQFLNATQLGITLSSLALGWIGEPSLAAALLPVLRLVGIESAAVTHTIAFAVAFAVLTVAHILLGEMVPKSVALRRAERLALATARPLILFRAIFRPVLWVLDALSSLVLRALGIPPMGEAEALSEEEVKSLIEAPHGGTLLPETKRALITRVLRTADRPVRLVMVPRVDIVYLDLGLPIEVVRERARAVGFSRLPIVTDDDIDRIVGYIHVRDLFLGEAGPAQEVQPILRQPAFVPESATVGALLHELQLSRVHLAIVVDEYGGTRGLVTLEDLLEELVGEIQDEFDVEEAKIVRLEEGRAMVDGSVSVADVAAALGIESPEPEADTLGGFVQSALGRMARQGDRVRFGELVAEVTSVRRRRVTKVLLRPPTPQESDLVVRHDGLSGTELTS